MPAEKFREITKSIDMLPPLPAVTQRLLEIAGDPKSTAKNMGEVICTDQAFSSKLLKLVNASFYGFSKQISTVSRAVVILGFDAVKSLAMGVSAFEVLVEKMKGGPLKHQDFWRHSLATAAAGKLLAEKSGFNPPEEAFVAGLLHDTGRLFLGLYAPRILELLGEEAKKNPGRDLVEIEQELMETDHCILAGNIFKHWNFPDELLWAVRRHHSSDTESTGKTGHLEAITFLANSLAKICCIGSSINAIFPAVPKQMMERLKLNDNALLQILMKINAEFQKTAAFLNIDIARGDENRQSSGESTRKLLLVGATPRGLRPLTLALESACCHVVTELSKEFNPARVEDAKPDILVIDARDKSFDSESLEGRVPDQQACLVISPEGSSDACFGNAGRLVAPFTVQDLLASVSKIKNGANV